MDDAALVEAVRAGRRHVFGTLVERHQQGILRLCWRIAGDPTDAEDLAHEAFIEAYVKLAQLQDPAKFGGWLRVLALNICRAWYRTQYRLTTEPLDDNLPDDSDPPHPRSDQLRGELNRLPAQDRLVLVLHYWEGLSYSDVAAFLDIPIGTVMSRLHRARGRLKGLMEMEQMEMPTDAEFRREVDAEIHALMTLFGAGEMERLSVLLEKSPERFLDLIRASNEEEMREDVAVLLRRLGRSGMEAAVSAYLSDDPAMRANASEVLKRCFTRPKTEAEVSPPATMAWREAYWLADTLIRSAPDATRKAQLLLELLERCPDDSTQLLLANMLTSDEGAGFNVLVARVLQARTVEEMWRSPRAVHTVCHFGSRWAKVLTALLDVAHSEEPPVALAAAEALSRAHRSEWLESEERIPERLALQTRFQTQALRWTPPNPSLRDPEAMEALAARVAAYVPSLDPETRNMAIRTLGLFGIERYRETIRNAAGHAATSTRTTALRALAAMGDDGASSWVAKALASPEEAERRAAIEAATALSLSDLQPEITQALDDPDRDVVKAAITALAAIGDDSAQVTLHNLLKSPDQSIVKAVAGAMFGGARGQNHLVHSGRARTIVVKPANRPGMAQIIRGGAKPPFYMSPDAAILALPEDRSYGELELTKFISQLCSDYSGTRRCLVSERLMTRQAGVYEFTERGRAVWRVEHHLARK
ncbi:MAG: sigma-70 family RNA polymerase sigma factor [Capsulimonas sp.]|uniref:sigma-70 family RNA polymerase sigma factor n=1 Tax=Capsulimonas sp. TaxID=2494211 RepID=UPI0032662A8F